MKVKKDTGVQLDRDQHKLCAFIQGERIKVPEAKLHHC